MQYGYYAAAGTILYATGNTYKNTWVSTFTSTSEVFRKIQMFPLINAINPASGTEICKNATVKIFIDNIKSNSSIYNVFKVYGSTVAQNVTKNTDWSSGWTDITNNSSSTTAYRVFGLNIQLKAGQYGSLTVVDHYGNRTYTLCGNVSYNISIMHNVSNAAASACGYLTFKTVIYSPGTDYRIVSYSNSNWIEFDYANSKWDISHTIGKPNWEES